MRILYRLCWLFILEKLLVHGIKLPRNPELKYQDFNAGAASNRQDKYTDLLNNDIQTRQRLRTFSPPVIETKDGKIRGLKVEIIEAQLSDVIYYLGIPYAIPPVGSLRWKKPKASIPWRGVKNATKMAPVCPQSLSGKLPNVLIPQWYKKTNTYRDQIMKNMDEDCLYLNIYVPATFYLREQRHPDFYRDPLPVMVYIHGHTFSEGSGNLYDGSTLASYGDVIVVTINYRLGVLGFLSTSDGNCPGNYGLWDQIKALQWLSQNIAAFGGDKTRVTLFGSGSGAASINLLMCSVQSDHSFARAILQSGTALAPWVIVRRPRQQARQFARSSKIKCYDISDVNIVSCLRDKSWRELIDVPIQTNIYNLAFGPVVDGANGVLADEPSKLMEIGEYLNFPILIGVSQGEGYGFVNRNPVDKNESPGKMTADRPSYTQDNFQLDIVNFIDSYYNGHRMKRIVESIVEFQYTDWSKKYGINKFKRSLLDMYTDKQWVEPIVRTAAIHSSFTYPVHFYTLNYRTQDESIPDWVDAGHGDELPFVFGAPLLSKNNSNRTFQYNFTNTDRMISSAVMTYWTNFVKNGDPMVGTKQKNSFSTVVSNEFQGIQWPQFDLETRRHLQISVEPMISDHYRAINVELWSTFLPTLVTRNDGLCLVPNIKSIPFGSSSPPNIAPRVTASRSTTTWTPKPGTTNKKNKGAVYYDAKSDSGISLQLSITLAIGFVLLFINIIAFAVVSYHKEKDKYKIEKLQNQLKNEKLKREAIDHNANKGSGLSRKETSIGDNNKPRVIDVSARDNGNNIHQYAYTLPRKAPPTRTYSASALPLVNPTFPRRGSFTSSGAQFSDDGYLHHTTGRSLKWKQLNGGNFKHDFDDVIGSNCSKTLSSAAKKKQREIERDDTYRRGGLYNVKTIQPSYTNNRFKTMPSRGIPSVIKIIKPSSPEKVNVRSSFSTLPTSSFCRTNHTFSSENSQPSEVNGFTNANNDPSLHSFEPGDSSAFTQTTQSGNSQFHNRDTSCNTKIPLLISPINETTRNSADTIRDGAKKF